MNEKQSHSNITCCSLFKIYWMSHWMGWEACTQRKKSWNVWYSIFFAEHIHFSTFRKKYFFWDIEESTDRTKNLNIFPLCVNVKQKRWRFCWNVIAGELWVLCIESIWLQKYFYWLISWLNFREEQKKATIIIATLLYVTIELLNELNRRYSSSFWLSV